MTMRDLLSEIAQKYDQRAGTKEHVPGQRVLRKVASRTDLGILDDWEAEGYGGKGTAALAPWVGVFDPKINRNPKVGLYLAYIFSTDLKTVTLTLQQGVTDLEEKIRERKILLSHLERQADRLFTALPAELAQEWNYRPSFGSQERPEAYEAASVVARPYDVSNLPAEDQLQQDLRAAESLLRSADAAEKALRAEEEEAPRPARSKRQRKAGAAPAIGFKPGNSSAYLVTIAAHEQLKNRKHELLIQDFATHIAERDYEAKNQQVHPKDLTLHRAGAEWLVEAKVLRNGDAAPAVRGAVGQLKEYSYFLYGEKGLEAPRLIALFSEDIGVYASYLEAEGIAAIWQTSDGWGGTVTAVAWGMVD
ncbi:MrcB family domain-containing protein [Streptomyces sp. NPDC003952]